MKLANVLIAFFVLFNVFFIKKMHHTKTSLWLFGTIAIPLLLDLLFIWNNSSFYLAVKATEKHSLFLIFPLFILGYKGKLDLKRLVKHYRNLMLIVLTILFIRYIFLYPDNFLKYLKGKHLWEMGYHFSNSFGNHAPALNMAIAFIVVISFYLLLKDGRRKWKVIANGFMFFLSFFFLMYVNTRVAIASAVFGCLIISFVQVFRDKNRKRTVKIILLTFVLFVFGITVFLKVFPYSIKKFTEKSFADMDKVGRLDEFENPESQIYGALVTRVTIWKSTLELVRKKFVFGYGATEAKLALFEYYKKTNQKFLFKYKFPVHNQFLDYFLKYGIFGIIGLVVFFSVLGYLAIVNKSLIMMFFGLHFFLSNLTDDFLILFSGISFSAFWFSVFGKITLNRNIRFEKN
ncbi:O-antigen ligase family protein [Tamlana crocina]